MICQIETGYSGCSQYFPPNLATVQTHGAYTVTLEREEEEKEGLVERRIHLQWEGGDRSIDHVQFPVWPNYGVVQNVSHLAAFVKKVS